MRAVDIIRKKRDGQALNPAEIEAFVSAATAHAWPDYQIAALLMAIVLRGMGRKETAALTAAMVQSGIKLDLSDLPGPKVDKHSTGGVGDKTSLIAGPLAAACGVMVPMMSGRGLGHTGGTLDKLEAIPGFCATLSLKEFRTALSKVGCAMVGQTAEIAPADKVLYALRDVTATVESVPLISASIMSKKIAEGIDGLVLDVKCGKGAFMKTIEEARTLADSLVSIGVANGVRTLALITAMDAPLGRAVGNALEVIEAIETLKGKGPADVESLSFTLAARMVRLGGGAETEKEAEKKVRDALESGRGLEKLRQVIEQQRGDPRVIDDYSLLPSAPERNTVVAEKTGYLVGLDAELIGRAAMVLGAGRDKVEDAVDPGVGIVLHAKVGDRVQWGQPLVELHYGETGRLAEAQELVLRAVKIVAKQPATHKLVLEVIAARQRAPRSEA